MKTAPAALIGALITGSIFVSMMAMVNMAEDSPPTTLGALADEVDEFVGVHERGA